MKYFVPENVQKVRDELLQDGARQAEVLPPNENIVEFLNDRAKDSKISDAVFLDALEFDESGNGPKDYDGKGLSRQRYTFRNFNLVTNNLAAAFQVRGFGEESGIGFIGENIAEMHLTYIATAKIGGLCAPLNPKDSLEKWLLTFRDCKIAAIVVQEKIFRSEKFASFMDQLRPLTTLREIFVVSRENRLDSTLTSPIKISLFSEALATTTAFSPPASLSWKRPFLLVYTSGTTGAPKGVVISLDTIWRCADSLNRHYGFAPGDATYAQLSGFHVNHIVVSFWGALTGGYRCFMTNRFEAKFYFEILRAEQITVSSVVPTNLAYALKEELENGSIPRDSGFHADLSRELLTSLSCDSITFHATLQKCAGKIDPVQFYDVLSSTITEPRARDTLKKQPQKFSLAFAKLFQPRFQNRYGLSSERLVIICGAGDLALDLALQFSRYTGLQITQGWGMSEGTCYSAMNLPRQNWLLYWLTLGSIGLEMSTTNMAIVQTDAELKPEMKDNHLVLLSPEAMAHDKTVGMIAMHGHVSSMGYYKNDAANRETHVDGWLLTGDAGSAFLLKDAPGFKRVVADAFRLGAADFNQMYPFISPKHKRALDHLRRDKHPTILLQVLYAEHPILKRLPYYFIKGRIKDIIIAKGQNIPCDEVEAGALKNPAVFEAVAVPIADIIDGEIPGIVVTRHPQATLNAQDVLDFCCRREILPRLCWPVMAAIVTQLPKTPTGKYQRVRAREIFAGDALKAPFTTPQHQIEVLDLAISKDFDLKRRPRL